MNEMRKLMEALDSIEEAGIGDEIKRKMTGKVTGQRQVARVAHSAIKEAIAYFEVLQDIDLDQQRQFDITDNAVKSMKRYLKTISEIEKGKR